jgi:hypothetical protein
LGRCATKKNIYFDTGYFNVEELLDYFSKLYGKYGHLLNMCMSEEEWYSYMSKLGIKL